MTLKGINLKGDATFKVLECDTATIGTSSGILKSVAGVVTQATPGVDFLAAGDVGDVDGPGASVNGNVASFSGTTGKIIADSGIATSNLLQTSSIGVSVAAQAHNHDGSYATTGHNHSGTYEPANANIQTHISNTSNPHSVTADQVLPAQDGNGGKVLSTNGTTASWTTNGSGDVTGPASSVDSEIAVFDSTTGKLIKRATTTGVLRADSGVISAATAGTHYLAPPSGTSLLKANSGGALANATPGTEYLSPAGAENVSLKTFNSYNKEAIQISATAATGTVNVDAVTGTIWYYTSNAGANWTFNFRGNAGTSLDSIMSTGQTLTIVFMVTQGGTAYYPNAHQIDGGAVTPKWQGGTAPTAGNVSSIDSYTYTIVKTGAATFTVFAAQTKFA